MGWSTVPEKPGPQSSCLHQNMAWLRNESNEKWDVLSLGSWYGSYGMKHGVYSRRYTQISQHNITRRWYGLWYQRYDDDIMISIQKVRPLLSSAFMMMRPKLVVQLAIPINKVDLPHKQQQESHHPPSLHECSAPSSLMKFPGMGLVQWWKRAVFVPDTAERHDIYISPLKVGV